MFQARPMPAPSSVLAPVVTLSTKMEFGAEYGAGGMKTYRDPSGLTYCRGTGSHFLYGRSYVRPMKLPGWMPYPGDGDGTLGITTLLVGSATNWPPGKTTKPPLPRLAGRYGQAASQH